MFCCTDCNLQTESTLTAVLFIDQASQQRNMLQHYAKKHLKNIRQRSHNRPQHLQPNKENQAECSNLPITIQNREQPGFKTKRKSGTRLAKSELEERMSILCQTGKFRAPAETSSCYRQSCGSRKNLESKTTSFGSLAGRPSQVDFLKKIEIKNLQDELQTLRQEEMQLLREKLQKNYNYKCELMKMNSLRDNLKVKSHQRQAEMIELKQLFSRQKHIAHE